MKSNPAVGFIGFGEAAYFIAKGLLDNGVNQVHAYDIRFDDANLGEQIRSRADSIGVIRESSIGRLCGACDLIICATNAYVALSVAQEVRAHLREHHVYVDLNSASGELKQKIADELKSSTASFVDVAVMDSVPAHGHKVPMLASGPGAAAFEEFAAAYGMNVTYLNEVPGSASAVKMLRSVFMKGLAALLLETLVASEAYGATRMIVDSLGKTIAGKPFEETINNLITRTAIHAERRVGEMEEVVRTLESLGVDSTISQAVKKKLGQLVEARLAEYFGHEAPKSYDLVLRKLLGSEV
ncbi:DUF1932 domain-containing protein [Cohnella laeviribosi]|uniref:DUF1932 domain-containing protein n=1 Tax=Cohnella laeviribosi TaxID=380174 RepID=UPI00037F8E32|nr:DUF1932 domain-containing protein [Cohnella laeviribosi]